MKSARGCLLIFTIILSLLSIGAYLIYLFGFTNEGYHQCGSDAECESIPLSVHSIFQPGMAKDGNGFDGKNEFGETINSNESDINKDGSVENNEEDKN